MAVFSRNPHKHWVKPRLLKNKVAKSGGTEWYFIPAGLFGGLAANYLQSTLEWVLRQQLNLVCLMFVFAIVSHLWTCSKKAKKHIQPSGERC